MLLFRDRECWLQVGSQSRAQTGAWGAHIGGVLTVAHAVAGAVLTFTTILSPPSESKESPWTQPGHGGACLDHLDQRGKPECLVNIVLGGLLKVRCRCQHWLSWDLMWFSVSVNPKIGSLTSSLSSLRCLRRALLRLLLMRLLSPDEARDLGKGRMLRKVMS